MNLINILKLISIIKRVIKIFFFRKLIEMHPCVIDVVLKDKQRCKKSKKEA